MTAPVAARPPTPCPPLLYVLGAAGQDEPVGFFTDDVWAAISMTGVKVG